tara:strand:+ start:4197 stop:4370 length:174 start_codon:yes stop_codon:yes gene_type:complete
MSSDDFEINKHLTQLERSDQTISGLMKELNEVKELVDNHPNNMELGKLVRAWRHKND